MSYVQAHDALKFISHLEEGWLDGEGTVIDKECLGKGNSFLMVAERESLPQPYVYPTEEGGIYFEWHHQSFAVSCEFSPLYLSHATCQITNTDTMETHVSIVHDIESIITWFKNYVA